ncbi:MAG: hypothetical protein ACRDMX_09575 [Solirubrobacteraceae bacterium]
MTWGFLWIMLGLKLPLAALILLVWWAIRQGSDEPQTPPDEDGGLRRPRLHPREPFPRRPRRGPHGGPVPRAPSRVRTVRARARTLGH